MIDYELIKNVVSMFVLNSVIEAFGFILYFQSKQKVNFTSKQFISLILTISIFNTIAYELIPATIFQLVYLLFLFLVFRYFTNIPMKNCVKSILQVIVFISIFEIVIITGLKYFEIDLILVEYKPLQLLYCMPIKLIEVFIIYILTRKDVIKNG